MRLIETMFGGERVWDSAARYDPAVRIIVKRMLNLGVPGGNAAAVRPVEDLVAQLKQDASIDGTTREGAIRELRRIGDRGLPDACAATREVVARADGTPDQYRRALGLAVGATRLAPWSPYCQGAVAMARYRSGDYLGALDALTAAASESEGGVPSDLLTLRVMSLARAGRLDEARKEHERLVRAPAAAAGSQLDAWRAEMESALRQR